MLLVCARCNDVFEVPDELIGDRPSVEGTVIDPALILCDSCDDDDDIGEDPTPNSWMDAEPVCTVCGADMEWEDCWNGCDDGYFDLYDEDPINYAPDEEYETCDICKGKGGYWVCPDAERHEKEKAT